MGNRLFVGGLSWATTDDTLREHFEAFGEVTDAKVVTDRGTGRSRGFGFVSYANEEDAESAREQLDGAEFDGRTLRVDMAQERRNDGEQGGGGGGRGGRGGRGGGGGGRRRERE